MKEVWCILVAITIMVFVTGDSVQARERSTESSASKAESVRQPAFLVKEGMRGENVKLVQKILTELGYQVGGIDGVCGARTVDAIMMFQLTHNIIPDGVVGESTLAYMHRAEPVVSRNMRSMNVRASAYSAYDPGNSSYTATGSFLRKGLVAVDPSVIPLGTRLYIPGYGMAIADDTGGAIVGNRIDLAFDSHGEALQFGRQEITIYIID